MKSAVLALVVCLAMPGLALAQDAGDAPAPGPGDAAASGSVAPGGGAPGGGKGGKMKAAVESCRTEVKSQGVKGPDRKKAIMDCISKEHPEFAGRMQCRQDGMAKGLSGDELKTFVRSCARSHG